MDPEALKNGIRKVCRHWEAMKFLKSWFEPTITVAVAFLLMSGIYIWALTNMPNEKTPESDIVVVCIISVAIVATILAIWTITAYLCHRSEIRQEFEKSGLVAVREIRVFQLPNGKCRFTAIVNQGNSQAIPVTTELLPTENYWGALSRFGIIMGILDFQP